MGQSTAVRKYAPSARADDGLERAHLLRIGSSRGRFRRAARLRRSAGRADRASQSLETELGGSRATISFGLLLYSLCGPVSAWLMAAMMALLVRRRPAFANPEARS